MKNLELKVVRFEAEDVIATSGETLWTLDFDSKNIGNNTDRYVESTGVIISEGKLVKNGVTYSISTKDDYDFYVASSGVNNYQSLGNDFFDGKYTYANGTWTFVSK